MVAVAAVLAWSGAAPVHCRAETPGASHPVESLSAWQEFVGEWKGVGQVRRGASEGAWIEVQKWRWKFPSPAAQDEATKPDDKKQKERAVATLTFESVGARHLESGELSVGERDGEFALLARSAGGEAVRYEGRGEEDGRLVLTAENPPAGAPARITFKLIAGGDRLVILYERKAPSGDGYLRLAEVGCTRQGSQFGKGTNFVECIVTGGKGVIPVEHAGQTYYVCCSGCRDLFLLDPQAAVDDYQKRRASRKNDTPQEPTKAE